MLIDESPSKELRSQVLEKYDCSHREPPSSFDDTALSGRPMRQLCPPYPPPKAAYEKLIAILRWRQDSRSTENRCC